MTITADELLITEGFTQTCPRLSRLRPSDTRPLQPQLQAGQASTRDVLKCALKTVDPKDYNVGFTPTEQAQLSSILTIPSPALVSSPC